MKFQEFTSFQRYFEQEMAPIVLLIVPHDYERAKMLEHLFFMAEKKGRYQKMKFSFEEMEQAFLALNSSSLFAQEPFVIIDGGQITGKKEEEKLLSYLNNPNKCAYCLLGVREKKGVCCAEIEQKGVVFDLGFEKAKDREKRLTEFFMAQCHAFQKTIQPEALVLFLEKTGWDLANIENEGEKLFCYVGEKSSIDKKDVMMICLSSDMRGLWELAEEFVWKQKPLPPLDDALFHPLVSAIRYQLRQGLLYALQEEKRGPFFYKKEEERKKMALQKGPAFFKRHLLSLFEIDLYSKNQVNSWDALLTYLQSTMFQELL